MRLAALVLVAGCTQSTELLPPVDLGAQDACTAPGPPIVLGSQDACAGALAARVERYALCSCESLLLSRGLFTGAGMKPPPFTMAPPAAVGTDGTVEIAGPAQLAGSLHAAGATGVRFDSTSAVLGTLRSGGPIVAARFLSVDGDAYAAGDVLGRIDVGGTLHVAPGATVSPSVAAGSVASEAVTVAPPCNCAAGPALDVGAELAQAAGANDDTRIGLAPDAFAAASGPAALDLPCGRFYLTALSSPVELELRVHGRVGLFVDGAVALAAGLRVTLDAGATLDLIARGDVTVMAGLVGAPNPAAVRLWLGASRVKLSNGAGFSALVYAPAATLVSDGDLDLIGALFVRSLDVPGDVGVRYDARALAAGSECGVAPAAPVD